MKKTYISPEMDVVELENQPVLLAGSVDGFASGLDETGGNGGDALAPEHEWYEWRF